MYIFDLLEVTILPNFKKEVTEYLPTTWRQVALDQPIFLLPNIIFKNGSEKPRPIKKLLKLIQRLMQKVWPYAFQTLAFSDTNPII